MNKLLRLRGWALYVVLVLVAFVSHTCATDVDSHAEPRRIPARQA